MTNIQIFGFLGAQSDNKKHKVPTYGYCTSKII